MAEQSNLQTDMQNYINSMFDNNDDEDDTNAALGIPSINDSLNIKNPLDVKPLATDNVFDYAIDKSQQLVGKGIQSFGDITGSETLQDFGESVATEQQRQIEEGGYTRPEAFSGGFTENLKAKNYGQSYGALNYSILESSPSLAVGAVSSAAAIIGSAPVTLASILLGTSYLATSGLGEMREEKEGQGVDATGNLTDLFSAVAYGLVEFVGGKGGKTFVQIAKDAGQEAIQEGIIVGNTAIQGGEYVPEELVERFLDSAAAGATTRTAIEGVIQSASFINERLTPAPSLTGEVLDSLPDVSTNQQEIPQLETPIIDLEPDVPSLTEPVPKITRTKVLPNFNFDNKPAQLSVTKSLPAPTIYNRVQEENAKVTTREEEIGRLLRVSQREMLKEAAQDIESTDITDTSFNNRLNAFSKIDEHYKRLSKSIPILDTVEEIDTIGNEIRLNVGSFSQTQAPAYIEKVKNIIQNTWELKGGQILSLDEALSVIDMVNPQGKRLKPKEINKLSPEAKKDYLDFMRFTSANNPNKKIYKMPINFLGEKKQAFIRNHPLSEDTIGIPVTDVSYPLYLYEPLDEKTAMDEILRNKPVDIVFNDSVEGQKNKQSFIDGVSEGIRTYSPVAMLMDNLVSENRFPDTKESFIKEITKLTLEQPSRPAIVTKANLRALNIEMIADQIYDPQNLNFIDSIVEEYNSSTRNNKRFNELETGGVDETIDLRTAANLANATTTQEKQAIYAKMLINSPLSERLVETDNINGAPIDINNITQSIINVDLETGKVLSHRYSVGTAIVDTFAEGVTEYSDDKSLTPSSSNNKNRGVSFDSKLRVLNLEKISDDDIQNAVRELENNPILDGEQVTFGNMSAEDFNRLMPKTQAIQKVINANAPSGPTSSPYPRYRTQGTAKNFYPSQQLQIDTYKDKDTNMTSYIRKDVITPYLDMHKKGMLSSVDTKKVNSILYVSKMNAKTTLETLNVDPEESNPLFRFDASTFEELRNMAMKHFEMPENVEGVSRTIAVRIPTSAAQLVAMGIKPDGGNYSIRYTRSSNSGNRALVQPPIRKGSTHGIGSDVVMHVRYTMDWANIPEYSFNYMDSTATPSVIGERLIDAPDREAGSRYQIETDKSTTFPHLELGDKLFPMKIGIVSELQTDILSKVLHNLMYVLKEAEYKDVNTYIHEDFIGPVDFQTLDTMVGNNQVLKGRLVGEVLDDTTLKHSPNRKFRLESMGQQDFDRRKELAVSNLKDAIKLVLPALILDAVKNGVEALVFPSAKSYMEIGGRGTGLTTRLAQVIRTKIANQYRSLSSKNYGQGTKSDKYPFLTPKSGYYPTDEEIDKAEKTREGKTDILDLMPKSESAYEITDLGAKTWKKYGPFVENYLLQAIEELLISDFGDTIQVKKEYVPYHTSNYISGLDNPLTPYQISKKSAAYMNDTLFDILDVLRFDSNKQFIPTEFYNDSNASDRQFFNPEDIFNTTKTMRESGLSDNSLAFVSVLDELFAPDLAQNINVRNKILGRVAEAYSKSYNQTKFKQGNVLKDRYSRTVEADKINELLQLQDKGDLNLTPLMQLFIEFIKKLNVLPNLPKQLQSRKNQGQQVTSGKSNDEFLKQFNYLSDIPAASFILGLVAADDTQSFIDKRIKYPIQFNNITEETIDEAFDILIDPILEIKELSEDTIADAKKLSKETPSNDTLKYRYDFKNYSDYFESQDVETLIPNIKENFKDEQAETALGAFVFDDDSDYLKYQTKQKENYIFDKIAEKRKQLEKAIENREVADNYLEEIFNVRDSTLARYMELSRNFTLQPMYQKDKATILLLKDLKQKLIDEGRAQEPLGKNRQSEDTAYPIDDTRGARKYQRGNPRKSRLPDKDVVSKTDAEILKGIKLRMRKGGLV